MAQGTGRLRIHAPRTLDRMTRQGTKEASTREGSAPWLFRRVTRLVLVVAVALGLWVEVEHQVNAPSLFPGPVTTLRSLVQLAAGGQLGGDIVASGVRILVGFSIASVVGVVSGVLLGTSRTAASVIDPYIQFFRSIPPIAWLGTVLLVFGSGERSKVL